ncbi:MAG: PEP/pyruvate-binding domain-containing protein, partial [Desulfobacula sp.]
MIKSIETYWKKYQAKKLQKSQAVIGALKIRYHTFRILLINNDRALKILNEIDLKLKRKTGFYPELESQAEELLGVMYELVDGLNHLSGNQYLKLYELHTRLSGSIRKVLPETPGREPDDAPYCLFLDERLPDLKKMVGGKAGALSDLIRIQIPVPDGFAITIGACQEFLRSNSIDHSIRRRLRRLETDEQFLNNLEETVREIREMIFSGRLTKELEMAFKKAYEKLVNPGNKAVSVRSSAAVEDQAAHSFAGQFKTVLNITSFEGLVLAFKEVLASNFNSRSIIYRFHAGLPLTDFDMAVICQLMVNAKTAGVLFTVNPAGQKNDRMLLSAVAGLGSLAVGGEVAADIYHPSRTVKEDQIPAEIAEKEYKEVCAPGGGVHRVAVPAEDRLKPLLSAEQIHRLLDLGLMVENSAGTPQDIEWAVTEDGAIYILQSRSFRQSVKGAMNPESLQGELIFQGGIASASGRGIGKVKIIHSANDLEGKNSECLKPGNIIAVLHQSLVDIVRHIHCFSGIVVDKGNPADHLSNVAREHGIPMLTRTGSATNILQEDQWVVLDADRSMIFKAPRDGLDGLNEIKAPPASPKRAEVPELCLSEKLQEDTVLPPPQLKHLLNLIVPLNLTDAYGPSFSIMECRSVHDLIRYVHEKSVMAMFNVEDRVIEKAGNIVYRLDSEINFQFLIIDMGGGLTPGKHKMKIKPEEILSVPLLRLWKGANTPGLRWNVAPPAPSLAGLLGRSLTDASSSRPL